MIEKCEALFFFRQVKCPENLDCKYLLSSLPQFFGGFKASAGIASFWKRELTCLQYIARERVVNIWLLTYRAVGALVVVVAAVVL